MRAYRPPDGLRSGGGLGLMLRPMSQDSWDAYALWCYGQYPLMQLDWDAHRRGIQMSAALPEHLADAVPYFDVEPMSEEEEEQAAVMGQTALQMELF